LNRFIGLSPGQGTGVVPFLELLRIRELELLSWFSTLAPLANPRRLDISGMVIYWRKQAFHQAHSASLLDEVGLPESAISNARSSMEHEIYLSGLLVSSDPSADVLDHLAVKSLRRTNESVGRMASDDLYDFGTVTLMLEKLIREVSFLASRGVLDSGVGFLLRSCYSPGPGLFCFPGLFFSLRFGCVSSRQSRGSWFSCCLPLSHSISSHHWGSYISTARGSRVNVHRCTSC